MIEHLIHDKDFFDVSQSSIGAIRKIYVDWENDRLVYELISGSTKQSRIKGILNMLRGLNYMKRFEH